MNSLWKRTRHRMKAFTIIELILVLLLSSMVVSMAYAALGFFSKNFESFRFSSSKTNEKFQLERLLRQDMSQCSAVYRNYDGIEFHFMDKAPHLFTFHDDYILRNAIDTFFVANTNLQTQHRGQEQFLPGDILDYISFEIISGEENYTWIFRKEYGADVTLNLKNDF